MSVSQILTITISIANLIGLLFAIYLYFRNPQIKSDQTDIGFRGEIDGIKKQIQEIKETHLKTVEQDIKNLTISVNDLGKTVIRLATIIDERIPKSSN
jgi:hypothetical protein